MLKPTTLVTELTNSFWNYGEGGAVISGVIAGVGVFFNSFVGGYDEMITFILIAMACDIVTGVINSLKNGKTNSEVMFIGGANKVVVFILIGLSYRIDILLGNATPILRTATIWFYLSRELLSVLENCGKLGIPLPPMLYNALEQITKKGGGK